MTTVGQIEKRTQTRIAAARSDIDTELAALQPRRDKTLALKQGMMQALLTGGIRLNASTLQPQGAGLGTANC